MFCGEKFDRQTSSERTLARSGGQPPRRSHAGHRPRSASFTPQRPAGKLGARPRWPARNHETGLLKASHCLPLLYLSLFTRLIVLTSINTAVTAKAIDIIMKNQNFTSNNVSRDACPGKDDSQDRVTAWPAARRDAEASKKTSANMCQGIFRHLSVIFSFHLWAKSAFIDHRIRERLAVI